MNRNYLVKVSSLKGALAFCKRWHCERGLLSACALHSCGNYDTYYGPRSEVIRIATKKHRGKQVRWFAYAKERWKRRERNYKLSLKIFDKKFDKNFGNLRVGRKGLKSVRVNRSFYRTMSRVCFIFRWSFILFSFFFWMEGSTSTRCGPKTLYLREEGTRLVRGTRVILTGNGYSPGTRASP